jgi:hypothetical protein
MNLAQTQVENRGGGVRPRPLWFYPSTASTIRWRARRGQLGVAPLLVGGLAATYASRQRRKSRAWGERAIPKDVKNEGRSGNVYENKGPCDNLPDTENDISARLHAILHKSTPILQKPSAFLSQFERWGTKPSLQNVETRCPWSKPWEGMSTWHLTPGT